MKKDSNDNQPSTSRQVLGLHTNLETPSTSHSPIKTYRPRKPFKKFKDDKPRTSPTKRNILNLRRTTLQRQSQKVLKKIINQSKKSPLSRQCYKNTTLTKVKYNGNCSTITSPRSYTVSEMGNDKNKEENTGFDDDCLCIEPQPETILIDDDCTEECGTVEKPNERRYQLSNYESIGSIRMNQSNMVTSTPNWKMIIDNGSSKVELPQKSFLADSTVDSDSTLEEKTLVTKSAVQGEVIVIDDTTTSYASPDARRKRKWIPAMDDSVIFVSENLPTNTTAYDFISFNTPTNESHFKVNQSSTSTPKPKRPRPDFFNTSERKQLNQYNDNAYNPNKDVPIEETKKRMVIVDGSNVAFSHALSKQFSVKGLKICLDYFEKMGHEVKAVVPQFRLQKQKSSDPGTLQKLHKDGKIVFTPCKNLPGKSSSSYDDRFILQLAAELDAAVVSNDNYRDLVNENSAFKKMIENRVIGYTWCNDMFILPKDPYGKWGPSLAVILNRS